MCQKYNQFNWGNYSGDVNGTKSLTKYCVDDPKDLDDLLFKIAGRSTFQFETLLLLNFYCIKFSNLS